MKKIIFILFASFAFIACENDQTDPGQELEQTALKSKAIASSTNLQIIEGVGVGNVVTLGMTRSEVVKLATNGNCDSAGTCSFKLSPETADITVTFDGNDLVNTIQVNQIAVSQENRWPTSVGVIDNMLPENVADLYEGAVTESEGIYTHVKVADIGYQYTYWLSCSDLGCAPRSVHLIFYNSGTNTEQREFLGDIVITNPSSSLEYYTIDLEIRDPEGNITTDTFPLTIAGSGSISFNPVAFVDLYGPEGKYYYTANISKKKGKGKRTVTVGTSTGSFLLVVKTN